MKKVILSAATIMAFTAISFAQDAVLVAEAPAAVATPLDEAKGDDKKEVEASALPDAVKATLASDKYKEWTVAKAWHVSGKAEHYVLEMKKGDETTTLKINKEGQVI